MIVWRGGSTLMDVSALPAEEMPGALPEVVGPREPVVVEFIHEFLKANFYRPDRKRLLFIVDPAVGLKEGGGGPLNHQIMAALRRRVPQRFANTVLTTSEFLPQARSFWISRSLLAVDADAD